MRRKGNKVYVMIYLRHGLHGLCHSERSEESRTHKAGVTEILRYALDDKMVGRFYFDSFYA